jgi:hypothetical protein
MVMTIVLPRFVHAEELPYTIGQGFDFFTGKYGTDTRTNTVSAPFNVMITPTDRLYLSVDIPFVYQNNENVVPGVSNGGSVSSTSHSTSHSESGLGDIIFRAGYSLVIDKDSMPLVRPSAFIKFPTADKSKSLGTGEFDGGFAVEISKWLGKWYPSVEAGYTVQGKSATFALRNYMTYNAGVAYQINDKFLPALLINGTSPPSDGTSSFLEVRLKLKYQMTKHTSIDGFISKGITTFTPEYGSGLAVFYNF